MASPRVLRGFRLRRPLCRRSLQALHGVPVGKLSSFASSASLTRVRSRRRPPSSFLSSSSDGTSEPSGPCGPPGGPGPPGGGGGDGGEGSQGGGHGPPYRLELPFSGGPAPPLPPPGGGPDPPGGPDSPDGSEVPSEEEGMDEGRGRRRERARVREAEEVKLLAFPTGPQWRAWRSNTIHAIVSAAGRHDDRALEWIMNVETHETVDL